MSKVPELLSRRILTIVAITAIAATVGCGNTVAGGGSGCNNANGIGGFTVHISDVNANNVVVGDAAGGSAYGNFASALSGTPLQGCATSFGSSSDFLGTPYTLQYGELPRSGREHTRPGALIRRLLLPGWIGRPIFM